MKILIISKSLPSSYKGGIQTHVWNLSLELIRMGHEVSILTAGNRLSGFTEVDEEGRKIISLPYVPSWLVPTISRTAGDYSFNKMVNIWVKRNGSSFDVIHAHGRSGSMLYKLEMDLPIVYTIHRLFSVEAEWSKNDYRSERDFNLHYKMNESGELGLLRAAKKIIAVSQQTATECYERYGYEYAEKLRVIHNGVKLPSTDHSGIETQRRLVYVGRLVKIKGLFSLLVAMGYIKPDIKLAIIGEGPDKKRLVSEINRLGLEERVALLGAMDQEDVYREISGSYALILPSFHESQGIVINEAHILGKPVIASNNSGIREMIKNGQDGLLFRAGDALHMASTVHQLFNDPDMACRLGARGKEKAIGEFLWNNIAQQTEKVYKEARIA